MAERALRAYAVAANHARERSAQMELQLQQLRAEAATERNAGQQ
jgi:hypothetical protein